MVGLGLHLLSVTIADATPGQKQRLGLVCAEIAPKSHCR